MDIDQLLFNESKRFQIGIERVRIHRNQWSKFLIKANRLFDEIRVKAQKYQLFENLYVLDNQKNSDFINADPFITLMWGSHPVGMKTIKQPAVQAVEKGCALHFAQNIFGHVICLIYPFSSDLHQQEKEYRILKVFDKPADISDKFLEKAVKEMFFYAHISSFVGNPNFYDLLKFNWLNLLSNLRKIGISKIIVSVVEFLTSKLIPWVRTHPKL